MDYRCPDCGAARCQNIDAYLCGSAAVRLPHMERTASCLRRENENLRRENESLVKELKEAYEFRPKNLGPRVLFPDNVTTKEYDLYKRFERLEPQVKRLDGEMVETNRRIDVLRGVSKCDYDRHVSLSSRVNSLEIDIHGLLRPNSKQP